MQYLKKRLPPLNALVAFEAAARHNSFTKASFELNLSQAAVSQQVRVLEQHLGLRLFERAHRSIRLSEAGRGYLHPVQASLNQIAAATSELTAPTTGRRLTVAADQSIAAMWLIPRLPDFQQRNPDIQVRLVASDIEADCLAEDIDIAIIHGTGQWPGFNSTLLFAEKIVAVCSPGYLSNNPDCNTLAGIATAALLNLESNHWNWMDWRGWLSHNGVHLPVQHEVLRINNYPLLIEMARNGQGLALGWRNLIDRSLADGSLIQPIENTVSTDYGYHIVTREGLDSTKGADVFLGWTIPARG